TGGRDRRGSRDGIRLRRPDDTGNDGRWPAHEVLSQLWVADTGRQRILSQLRGDSGPASPTRTAAGPPASASTGGQVLLAVRHPSAGRSEVLSQLWCCGR